MNLFSLIKKQEEHQIYINPNMESSTLNSQVYSVLKIDDLILVIEKGYH